jgi:hypothetical protein
MHGATKKFEKNLVNEQEVLNNIAEMMMETYLSESLALRIEKMSSMNGGAAQVYRDILDVNIYDTAGIIRKSASDAVNSFASAEDAGRLLKAVEDLSKVAGVNVKDARRRIADKLITENSYNF